MHLTKSFEKQLLNRAVIHIHLLTLALHQKEQKLKECWKHFFSVKLSSDESLKTLSLICCRRVSQRQNSVTHRRLRNYSQLVKYNTRSGIRTSFHANQSSSCKPNSPRTNKLTANIKATSLQLDLSHKNHSFLLPMVRR